MIFLSSLLFSSISYANNTTLISPMIGGLDICHSALKNKKINNIEDASNFCYNKSETASLTLESKLSEIGGRFSENNKFELGYILPFPLLNYVNFNGEEINIDKKKIKHRINLLKETNRSVVLYFFSNHFSTSHKNEIENTISNLDDNSLMQLSNGKKPIDIYFKSTITPWAINSDTLLDKVRVLVIKEIMAQICSLTKDDKDKIKAITVLGEVHYTFPNFFNGMGYNTDYKITDYSKKSTHKFHDYLIHKYNTIDQLNKKYNAAFLDFSDIRLPSKDIKKEKLNSFFEHLDKNATGKLAITGWLVSKNSKVRIYLNGKLHGYAVTELNRMDVYQVKPEVKTAALGYRYYLDFKNLQSGVYNIDVVLDSKNVLTKMTTLELSVMDREQSTPPNFSKKVPFKQEKEIQFWNDTPKNKEAVYYNPLAEDFIKFNNEQVKAEIEKYSKLIGSYCINKDKIYSHQISPMLVSDWDESKFAVTTSLKPNDHYNLGLNTYGAGFYSNSFFNWVSENGFTKYGIPEAHPMINNQKLIYETLLKHNKMGATFIAPYFIRIQPDNYGLDIEHEKFRVASDNDNYGSSSYFRALNEIFK